MMKLPTWLSYALVIIISVVWAVNFTAGIFIKTYQPPDSINLVFSSMITTLLLTRHRTEEENRRSSRRRYNEGDEDDEGDES